LYLTQWPIVVAKDEPWDVVVLGAGPAGAIAALQLARAGCRVLLVEKSCLPRVKVCGGCLSGAALDILEMVGLKELPERCGGVTLRRMRLASGGIVAEIDIGRRLAISRQTFDDALVREAVRAGVTVCDDTQGAMQRLVDLQTRVVLLRHRGREDTVRARAVLIATGLSSCPSHCTTRTWSRSRIGVGTLLQNSDNWMSSDVLHMAWGVSGYVGMAAVDGQRLDIAAAVDPNALTAGKSPGMLVSKILNEAGLPPVHGLKTAVWRGTPLLTRQTRPLGAYRCLLIGDATGYVEPFTGEGIAWAMQSAVMAASLVVNQLEQWNEATTLRWERLYAETLSGSQRYCSLITRLLRSKAIRQLAVKTLARAPLLARPIVRRFDHSIPAAFGNANST
jgi:flavin-dependent dehydrogenase